MPCTCVSANIDTNKQTNRRPVGTAAACERVYVAGTLDCVTKFTRVQLENNSSVSVNGWAAQCTPTRRLQLDRSGLANICTRQTRVYTHTLHRCLIDHSCERGNTRNRKHNTTHLFASVHMQVEMKSGETSAAFACADGEVVLCSRQWSDKQSGSAGDCFFVLGAGREMRCSGDVGCVHALLPSYVRAQSLSERVSERACVRAFSDRHGKINSGGHNVNHQPHKPTHACAHRCRPAPPLSAST
jgi:hypothetical protein